MALCVRLFAIWMLHGRPAEPLLLPVHIDLNWAGIPELMALPGIGRARAEAIILHRVRHGPFRRVEELQQVDGIGPETAAGLATFARVGRGSQTPRARLP